MVWCLASCDVVEYRWILLVVEDYLCGAIKTEVTMRMGHTYTNGFLAASEM